MAENTAIDRHRLGEEGSKLPMKGLSKSTSPNTETSDCPVTGGVDYSAETSQHHGVSGRSEISVGPSKTPRVFDALSKLESDRFTIQSKI